MEYTSSLLSGFIDDLDVLDKEIKKVQGKTSKQIANWISEGRNEWSAVRGRLDQSTINLSSKLSDSLDSRQKEVKNLYASDIASKRERFDTLKKCKEILSLIECCESGIEDREEYEKLGSGRNYQYSYSIVDMLSGNIDFVGMSNTIDTLLHSTKKKDAEEICTKFFSLCRYAESTLSSEIDRIRTSLVANLDSLIDGSESIGSNYHADVVEKWNSAMEEFDQMAIRFAQQSGTSKKGASVLIHSTQSREQAELEELTQRFCSKYPPKEFADEYKRLYALEPSYTNYMCTKEMPKNIHLASLECDITAIGLSDFTKSFLNRYYYFIYRGDKICIPYCASFGPEFNYMFQYNGERQSKVVQDACDLGMRLFMMLPPGKVRFTFIDPVKMGDSFAIFKNLVNVEDRTSEVINGKIWSDPSDIEDRLRTMTKHISDVIQSCLKGQYNNIYEYNKDAGLNGQAYQVIMVMDYPAGFSEQALHLLEQIAASGPKCGVFTLVFFNEKQYKEASDRLYPMINKVQTNFCKFSYSNDTEVIYSNVTEGQHQLLWHCIPMPAGDRLGIVMKALRDGIKNAEKIVIGLEEIIPPKSEWFKGNCSSELSIPIGVHGANNIQNLTFGVGGRHHALIAGQTGSGKSSLLHTIIMSALIKYPSDELQIYLVDFKRGVEFKIYANYSLENFKVIAIESEREFGSSVLEYLDVEQSKRADKFKELNVDNVEDYRRRAGEKLPRILLIIDEFHVLFSKDTTDFNSKKSSAHLEQIIRQGRAFGIHAILASQTVSNTGGINYGVWGQVGVRIALKCPKSDAKFILGNDNDGVDLLTGDNPGQAIYNSDCGNVVANSVFRVAYIDQEEQDKYLRYISENEPKFGFPETRVMLSNVKDNIYNPLQRFVRGENYQFVDNAILVGEPLKLVNNMKMEFKAKHGSNMLIIGNDEQKARTMFTFAALSLALHILTQNGYHTPTRPRIYLFDYAPLESFDENDVLLDLAKMLPGYVKYVPFDETDEAMKELYQEFKNREQRDVYSENFYMLIYGLQRARNLRSNDIYKKNSRFDDFDEFGENVEEDQLLVKPYDMFINLVQRGSRFGINAIVWEDNFKLFMNNYADMLSNFNMRVAFTMPDDDSINFIEEVDGSKISETGAVYNYNGNQKFRPYKRPDSKWLVNICERINSFNTAKMGTI